MSASLDLDQALGTFIAEARELLERMEISLLGCESGTADAETINDLFRSAHTIKGSSGLFGLDDIVSFTHVVETSLDRVRSGKQELTSDLVAVLLECNDHIARLVDAVASRDARRREEVSSTAPLLLGRLQALCGEVSGTSAVTPVSDARTPPDSSPQSAAVDAWHISLRFDRDVLRKGLDPLGFIRYLKTFGEILGVQVLTDRMPTPDSVDPEACYLGFEIRFRSAADKTRIEAAFEFVREDCRLRILPPRSRIADYIALIQEQTGDDLRLGQLLVGCGTLTEQELTEALEAQKRGPSSSPKPLGEVLVEQRLVQPPVVEAALARQAQQAQQAGHERPGGPAQAGCSAQSGGSGQAAPSGPPGERKASQDHSIRIDAGKLDRLIDIVGQLTLTGSSVDLLARRSRDGDLRDAGLRLGRLVEDVRASALQLRMVQIGATFSRFQRVVRDVSAELGKSISLKISGADTELDKTLVEHISDPLLHLVRNAIDHGIEPAEARAAKGKPAQGTLSLTAAQDAGSIVIEVSDDGAGIDRAKVLAKARQRGLVPEGETPPEDRILNLILEPGFSTADVVTNLSGRGVGLDVVKRNVEQLRGTLEIHSRPGAGTTFRIRLPLTLAIIDGFLLRVGGVSYVVPLELVEECIELGADHTGGDYLPLRGSALPLLPLYEAFEHRGKRARRRGVLVVRWGGRRAGLVVDELLGKMQTVIKPLSPLFTNLGGISGSTVLGDGTIALLLDVPGLIRIGETLEPKHLKESLS